METTVSLSDYLLVPAVRLPTIGSRAYPVAVARAYGTTYR